MGTSSAVQSQPQPTSKSSIVVLITATTLWPLSARLAVRLIAHGCRVHALSPWGHALNAVTGMGKVHHYAGFDPLAALEKAIRASRPDVIMPCDDRAVWQLHELHAGKPDLRELIEASLGAAQGFPVVRCRARLMEAAKEAGIRVPATGIIRSPGDIQAWFDAHPSTAVVKLDGTWGGSGVKVVRSVEEAAEAWTRFTTPEARGTRLKRWTIDRDPLAFWSPAAGRAVTVSIQQFIPGRPANAMLAARRGALLGLVSVEVLCSQGPTGASTVVHLIDDPEIEHIARCLVGKLGLSGFHGLDFMLEEGSGLPYLIELNARCTQLGHLILPRHGDLAGVLAEAWGACGPARHDLPIDRGTIAFFPQALAWNPDSPHMQQCHHDVPWSEPALVRELLRDPWPERRWLSRVYNRLRGTRRLPLPNPASLLRMAASDRHLADPLVLGTVKQVTDTR